jgi:hypothetical protein
MKRLEIFLYKKSTSSKVDNGREKGERERRAQRGKP